jgi:hypothetical protein
LWFFGKIIKNGVLLPPKKNLMKKQKIYLIVASLLAILAISIIFYEKGGLKKTFNAQKISQAFAIKDTATITRVFMADMHGNKVLLTKTPKGWIVDNHRQANHHNIRDLLVTLTSIRIAQPIAKSSQSSIIKLLSVKSTKVEVYETKPLFSLFKKPFFIKERLIKTFFLGDATPVNLGSYALLEGMSEPYIVYKPGFRGYVTPQFLPFPKDWYSHRIFETKLTRIQNVSFIDIENPDNTFFVEKSGPRTFTLYDHHKEVIQNYDTTLLINMLSEFRERNYENFITNMEESFKDSILQFNLFKIISLTDVENNTTTMKLYHFIIFGELWENEDLIDEVYQQYSLDRAYATINDNNDEIFTIQFYQFDRQVQPQSYYLKK